MTHLSQNIKTSLKALGNVQDKSNPTHKFGPKYNDPFYIQCTVKLHGETFYRPVVSYSNATGSFSIYPTEENRSALIFVDDGTQVWFAYWDDIHAKVKDTPTYLGQAKGGVKHYNGNSSMLAPIETFTKAPHATTL